MMGRSGDGYDHIRVIRDVRYYRFMRWQTFQATLVYILCKILICLLSPSTTFLDAVYAFCKTITSPLTPSYILNEPLFEFLKFQFSLHIFCTPLFLICYPPPVRRLSPIVFLLGLLKLISDNGDKPLTFDYRLRVWVTLIFVIFVVVSGVCASLAVVVLSGYHDYVAFGLRGFVAGLHYALHYRRWVLDFPIVQRHPFFHYKLGVSKAVIKAVKLSNVVCLLTFGVSISNTHHKGQQLVIRDFIMEQIVFYFACVEVFICWELNRNLLQIFLTERLIFTPPKGSAALKTNPSDYIVAVLEDTTPRQLVRCLAYYDLCMVSESNVDTWRRAAFFEKTGETYKRVIDVCLKPLEQLTLDLSSNQLYFSSEFPSRLNEPFYEFQIFAWCARSASSLTVCSKKEDCYGVARFSGSNAATISTFLSSLLAIETILENKKESPHYSKAYSMADILRTSIYQIVSVFHQEIVASYKVGSLQKDWITSSTPLYGSRELLVQKLCMFLEFQAN